MNTDKKWSKNVQHTHTYINHRLVIVNHRCQVWIIVNFTLLSLHWSTSPLRSSCHRSSTLTMSPVVRSHHTCGRLVIDRFRTSRRRSFTHHVLWSSCHRSSTPLLLGRNVSGRPRHSGYQLVMYTLHISHLRSSNHHILRSPHYSWLYT